MVRTVKKTGRLTGDLVWVWGWGGRKDLCEEATFPRKHEEWKKGGSLEKSLLGRGASRSEEEHSRLVFGSAKSAAVSEQGGRRKSVLGGEVGEGGRVEVQGLWAVVRSLTL